MNIKLLNSYGCLEMANKTWLKSSWLKCIYISVSSHNYPHNKLNEELSVHFNWICLVINIIESTSFLILVKQHEKQSNIHSNNTDIYSYFSYFGRILKQNTLFIDLLRKKNVQKKSSWLKTCIYLNADASYRINNWNFKTDFEFVKKNRDHQYTLHYTFSSLFPSSLLEIFESHCISKSFNNTSNVFSAPDKSCIVWFYSSNI